MNRILSRIAIVMVASMVVVALGASTAMAVTVAPKKDDNAAKVIQKQLDKAKKKGKANKPYVVTVKKGTYTLDRSLRVYSNTVLNLKGVTFKLKKNTTANMIRVGNSNDKKTGYYYKNITINGGVFNGNKTKSTVIKIAHAKNVTLNGCVFKNAYNSHLAEVAAVDGFKVLHCTFRDQIRKNKSKVMSPEALQLDIVNKVHFPTYRADDTTVKNVVIDHCKFINLPRAVGSHTGILNNPMTNISVTNCTFQKIASVAIQFQNTINLTIEGNRIEGAPRGIGVFTLGEQGMFLAKTIAKEGKTKPHFSSAYKEPLEDQNIVIRNNHIKCSGKDPNKGFENEAIVVKGDHLTAAKKSTGADKMPAGSYYLSGVTIEGNEITTVGHGIRLRDTRNSYVIDNKVSYVGSKKSSTKYYGIQTIERCSYNMVNRNVVNNAQCVGIYVSDHSQASSVSGNTITKSGQHGIAVYDGSSVAAIMNNTITGAGNCGIHIFKNSKVGELEGNVITGYAKYDIFNG